MIHAVYGFKEALQPYVTKIAGHSKARWFHFIKHQENVAMFYKESSLDEQWRGLPSDNNRGILLFHNIPPSDLTIAAKPTNPLDEKVLDNILKDSNLIDPLSYQSKSFFTTLHSGMHFILF